MTEKQANPAEHLTMWQAVILFLSVYVLLALFVETVFDLPAQMRMLLTRIDDSICLVFIGDFIYRVITARSTLGYLKWGWIDLISSIPSFVIPYVEFLRWGRVVRVFRILRILRGIRSTKLIVHYLFENRAQGTFASVAMISFVLLIFSSVVILNCETDPGYMASRDPATDAEPNIKTANDALWWSVVTMATVGYGDKYPVTVMGRIVATFLMIDGVGLFGTFTAYVASLFVKSGNKVEERHIHEVLTELRDIKHRLDRIEKHAGPPSTDRGT